MSWISKEGMSSYEGMCFLLSFSISLIPESSDFRSLLLHSAEGFSQHCFSTTVCPKVAFLNYKFLRERSWCLSWAGSALGGGTQGALHRWRLEDKGVQGEVGTHRELWRDLLSRQRQWLLSGNIALSFLDNWCYLLNSHLMITTEIHPFSQYLAKSSHTESAKILPLPRSPTLMEDWIRF